VNHARFLSTEAEVLVLEISSAQDCQPELWGLKNHEKAFEEIFGKKLVVTIVPEITKAKISK
jgi:hypothetical protein